MTRMLLPLCLIACAGKPADTGSAAVESAPMDPCARRPSPTLELGHGELGFESLGDGTQTSELIHGPQGGYHTNIALSATGLDATGHWAVDLEGWIGNALIGHTIPLASMRCNRAENELQAWGLLLIWDGVPAELHGQTADIEATVVDSAGTEMTAVQSLIIWDPGLE